MWAFGEKRPKDRVFVHHRDGDKSNNSIDNLVWEPRKKHTDRNETNYTDDDRRLFRWRKSARGRYSHCKNQAKRKGHAFNITFEDYEKII